MVEYRPCPFFDNLSDGIEYHQMCLIKHQKEQGGVHQGGLVNKHNPGEKLKPATQ
jgi:hypothetical protein